MDRHYLIVGLGNPGAEYAKTRHNAGFLAVELLLKRHAACWINEFKFNLRFARIKLDGSEAFVCQPQTFMNLSGEAVERMVSFYKIPLQHVLVVVDDADLALGHLRLRPGGSSGGHHGLESVETHLGTRDYARQRIGIGRQESGIRKITGHVLGKFSSEEIDLLDKVLNRAVDQIECWINKGIDRAMNQFNGAVGAPQAKDI